MNELTREEALMQYIEEFLVTTNGGELFVADISSLHMSQTTGRSDLLSPEEARERTEWAEIRRGLTNLYHEKHRVLDRAWGDLSPSEMLLLPLAQPLLNDRTIAARSQYNEEQKRIYLNEISYWNDFQIEVKSLLVPKAIDAKGRGDDVLYDSLKNEQRVTYEIEEMGFINRHVLEPLRIAGLLEHRSRADALDQLQDEADSRQQPADLQDADAPVLEDADAPVLDDADSPDLEDADASDLEDADASDIEDADAPDVDGDASDMEDEDASDMEDEDASDMEDEDASDTEDSDTPSLGNADHFLMAGGTKVVPIEFKATHNLPVPNTADVVIRRYNRMNTQSIRWLNIAYPLGQLIYYMFVGRSRYGVLSSGTRTYFLKVLECTDGRPKVLISNSYFVGRPGYLRAWACFFGLAEHDGDFQPPDEWEDTWALYPYGPVNDADGADDSAATGQDPPQPGEDADGADDNADDGTGQDPPQPGEDADGADDNADDSPGAPPSKRSKRDDQECGAEGRPTRHFISWVDPSLAPSIPRVDGKKIKLLRLLGHGNHDVYLARWKGNQVAVKAFDFYKGLSRFESEIRAYEHLKSAWGVLVPEPYFIARKRGLLMLGMQLGRSPTRSDRKFESELFHLFRTLRHEHGFVHLDGEPRNVVYIPDKRGEGKARLVAIDLEAHKISP